MKHFETVLRVISLSRKVHTCWFPPRCLIVRCLASVTNISSHPSNNPQPLFWHIGHHIQVPIYLALLHHTLPFSRLLLTLDACICYHPFFYSFLSFSFSLRVFLFQLYQLQNTTACNPRLPNTAQELFDMKCLLKKWRPPSISFISIEYKCITYLDFKALYSKEKINLISIEWLNCD